MVRKNTKYLILVFTLFLGVGFAVLTSNLNIEGIFNFAESSFEVYFDNVVVNPNSIEANKPVINNSKTTITFGGQLDKPGDFYEFTVDVVNNGTMGAMLDEIIKTGITLENEDFINYTVTYYDGTSLNRYDLLPAGSRTKIIVRVEYEYDIDELPNISSNMDFSLSLKYVKSNDKAIDVDTNFYNSGKSNYFNLSNARANSLIDLKIYGNTKQNTYIGKNLFNYEDIYEKINGFSIDEEGWITVSYDNSSGTSNVFSNCFGHNLIIDSSKRYKLVIEVKEVTGTGTIYPTSYSYIDNSGQFGYITLHFSELQNNIIKVFSINSRSDYVGDTGLRTSAMFSVGESGSITFRLSVLEDTTVTAENFVYEPYVGCKSSPNPDYQQEVSSVTGNTELKITGKNLFYIGNNTTTYHGIEAKREGSLITLNGITTAQGNLLNLGNVDKIPSLGIFKAGTYTATIQTDSNYNTDLTDGKASAFYIRAVRDNNSKLVNTELSSNENTVYSKSFTLNEATELYFQIFSNGKDLVFDDYHIYIQIEQTDTASEYEPYKEKNYQISLDNIELNKIGDYRDYIYNINNKWYIHKEIGKYTMTGNEQVSINTDSTNTTLLVYNNVLDYNARDNIESISNRLQYNKMLASDEEGFYFDENSKNLTLRINKSTIGTTISDINTYFSNNNTYFYYILANPKDIEITDTTLLSHLNAILNNNLYDGTNNITYISNIDTDIEFNYMENNS